jgi:hypothetical protein
MVAFDFDLLSILVAAHWDSLAGTRLAVVE